MQKEMVEGYRLSPQQEHLWSQTQAEPGCDLFVQGAILVEGALRTETLAAALGRVVGRHEILRTSFRRLPESAAAVQLIEDGRPFAFDAAGPRDASADGREPSLEALLARERVAGGDADAPLEARLVPLAENRHALLLRLPALCADAATVRNLVPEIAAAYAACASGDEPPEEPTQFADLSAWQNELLESEETEEGRAFWAQHDLASLHVLALPFENTNPTTPAVFAPEYVEREVGGATAAALEALARTCGATTESFLLACWQTLLWRLTGQADLTTGLARDGRVYEELKGSLGPLSKFLPLRAGLGHDESFREALGRVAGLSAELDRWQQFFSWGLRPEAAPGERFFPLCFEFHAACAPAAAAGLTFSLGAAYARAERFKLKLACFEAEGGFVAQFHYDPAVASAREVGRLAGHYLTLLESAVRAPDTPVGRLDLLGEEERRRVLFEWNDTGEDYPRDRCAHQLFEEQAERTPEAVAVVSGERQLTYRELNERANRLARHLRGRGVGPGVLVGLFLEHSPETLVGILGVLKAGGAYVPFDPAHPSGRVAQMIEDARLPLILTHEKLAGELPATGALALRLDADWPEVAGEACENLDAAATPDSLAYVIYTSGSTGVPKGVEIAHRSLVNYVCWAARVYVRGERLSFALYTSLAFDLTVTSVYTPLFTGNRVVVYVGARRHSPLAEIMRDDRVEVLKLTPSHLSLIKDRDNRRSRVRRLIVGGEALETKLAAAVSESFGGRVEIFNEYGPTEATVGCMIHLFDPERDRRAAVPVGRPAANTRVYVLDAGLRPAPENVAGELYVAGDGLARGYLNREEVTREKFVADPFFPGELMYRTGDSARRLAGGVVEYGGRLDEQVKFHGYRVELNEIRGALNRHPQVRDSVVLMRKNQRGDDVLVAYYVSRQEIDPAELRAVMLESVVEETVPNLCVHMRRLPLTLNGKVDHRALPGLEEIGERMKGAQVTPRGATEELLAGIWAEVLGVERVGVFDNFFELGGHSLLAAQVMSRVRESFQVELLLRVLFESPTVAGLAAEIESAVRGGGEFRTPPLAPVSREQDLPLSYPQQRLWLLDQLDPGSPSYNVPTAVRLTGRLDVAALGRTLTEIVRRHESLRTVFRVKGGEPLQVIEPAGPFDLEVTDLGPLPVEERETEARRLATEEARRPFNLSAGPLLRAGLLRLSEEEHVVLFTMHHIVSDGWSMGVLVREVAALYAAFSENRPSPLAELPVQYADYAHWQREWLKGEVLEEQLNYWRKQLEGAPALLELPTDRPRSAAGERRGAHKFFGLSQELSAALKELSRKEGVTLFMTLVAGFQALLHRYSGQERIVVGTDFANRSRVETESLIGFFINILVMHTDLSGDPDFRGLLGRVRETALGAYAHQHLPFEKLVEAVRPERRAGQTPLVQALFVLQNARREELRLPGLALAPFEFESSSAKFDVAVFVTETEGGLGVRWDYNAALFDATTVERMWADFEALLGAVAARPEARLSELKPRAEEAPAAGEAGGARRGRSFKQFRGSGRKVVSLPQGELVEVGRLAGGGSLPVVSPAAEGLDLADWAAGHRDFLEAELLRHGAVLMRGFEDRGVDGFERFAQALCAELFSEYGDLPRESQGGKVYGSTPYPQDKAILFHNESSHLSRWPQKIWFYCRTAALTGGETPVADCREVYRLLDPRLRERFERKRLMYVRNFTEGLDVSWQNFFQTSDRAAVEEMCRRAGVELRWREGGGLTTRQVRPAVAAHPRTGEPIFFNQLQLHHVSCLDAAVRDSLLSLFGENGLPRNVYYGDGEPVEDSVMEEVGEVYRRAAVSFPWREGDILMLDNMLTAHSRNPYTGPRKIVVAMGDMFEGGRPQATREER